MSVLLSTDMFTLIDEDAIVAFDPLIKTADDQDWLKGFYPAFMENSQTGGKTWGIPFQRSTIVLYYNKEMFKDAGLDPNHPPATWEEMASMRRSSPSATPPEGHAMGRADSCVRISVPAVSRATTANGVELMNSAGTQIFYDKPQVIDALQYWVTSNTNSRSHPEGVVEWGTTPKDFFERKVAMMWTTTGNLTNVKTNAKFDFGVGMLPANKRRGSPTGGGNFYIFKQARPEQQAAALKFIKWITSPARAAQWGIDTGYVAVRPDAWETPAMKKYVADFPPAAVARDQLQFSVAELSTHDNQRVTKALNDGLQAALTNSKAGGAGDEGRAARGRRGMLPALSQVAHRGAERSPCNDSLCTDGCTAGCWCCLRRRCSRCLRTIP